MKFGVVVFPGSNCDRDMIETLKFDLNQEVIELWHKDNDISMFDIEDCIVLPGGFSFGDYLRCGAIAKFSPMMQCVIEFANRGGKVLALEITSRLGGGGLEAAQQRLGTAMLEAGLPEHQRFGTSTHSWTTSVTALPSSSTS